MAAGFSNVLACRITDDRSRLRRALASATRIVVALHAARKLVPQARGGLAALAASGEMTMQGTENTAALLGRIAMSVIFIHGGWGKLLAPAATQAMLASHHLPMVKLGWILAVVVELGGGLAILLGLFTRPIGLVLAIWCVATALIAHTHFADRNQQIHFLKNMAMMGGFLYVAAFGARAWSLDARWSRRGR
jgi:putative oxidoreductase